MLIRRFCWRWSTKRLATRCNSCSGWLARCCRSERDLADGPSLLAGRCLILDHHPPDLDGLALLPFLQGCCPRLAVILLVGMIDARLAAQVAGFGLGAIIEKPLLDHLLLDAVRQVLGQGQMIS
jgi:FixJ family two-component response regulator